MPPTDKQRADGTRRPLERVMRIHELVRQGRYPNCTQIASQLEVNRKTIQRDLNFMREELALPLEYDERSHGYFYARPVSDFPFVKASPEDLVAMVVARKALAPMRGSGGSALEDALRCGFQRIHATMGDQVSLPWRELEQAFSVKEMGMAHRDDFCFHRLIMAILESRELRFQYRKLAGAKAEQRRVHPYHLTEIEGGWYLLAFDLERQARRTFAVQRIRGVEVRPQRFVRNREFTLEDHFAGSFGVWAGDGRDAPIYSIKIRFWGYAARVVAEREWHPSQSVTELSGSDQVELRLELRALEDVTRWVLGFGSQAEVIGPPELRKIIQATLREALLRYE